MQHELILVGGGSGTAEYLLPAAKQALEQVDCVIASERFLRLVNLKTQNPCQASPSLSRSCPSGLSGEV